MKQLKTIFNYLLWIALALLLGLLYIRLLLGTPPNEKEYNGWGYVFKLIYTFGLLRVGLIIGTVVAVLFIVMDVFYLKKRLNPYKNTFRLRLLVLFSITLVVAVIHYILEKVIDII